MPGLVLALVLALAGFGAYWWQRADARARIPAPPEDARLPAVVAEHVRGRYVAALADPRSGAAIGALCRAYHADMLFDHAEVCYEVASERDSREWRWTYSRALILAERGGGDALAAALREVVTAAPEFGPAWLKLGDAEFKAGRYDAAEEAWRRAGDVPEPAAVASEPVHVVEVPMASHAGLGLARIALVRGDGDRAIQTLEEVTRRSPSFGMAFRLLAEAYRAAGREDAAASALYRANRLPPFAPYADPMVDALALESRNVTLLLRLASEATLSINGAWAEHLTRRAAGFDPDNPEVVLKLARILRTFERNDEALALFERYRRQVPDDLQVLAHIGSCLSALGRYGEAESFFRRALAGLDDPVTHYNLALLLSLTGRPDAAIAEYELALAGDPRHSDARSNLAASLARRGETARAIRELSRVIEQDPEHATARANLGLLLLQQGRTGEARTHLEAAVRINPRLSQAADLLATIRAGP